jgi:hypothetical protein
LSRLCRAGVKFIAIGADDQPQSWMRGKRDQRQAHVT